jgi:flagellar hook protein FlgE
MSILTAMSTGVSGLDAESEALGLIGNNLANSNTVGFKQSRAVFDNVLGAAVGTEGAIGQGVRMATSQQIFSEGSLINTGQPTDVALSGDGFFVVNGNVGGQNGNFYTRAGQTSLDKNGTLVNPDGLAFQGYGVNPDGTFGATLQPLTVNTAALTPKAAPWDPQNPGPTSNFSTSMPIYDSLGNPHTVNLFFTNTGSGTWTYHALANGSEVQGGTAGKNSEIATGTLTFNTSGALQNNAVTAGGTVSFVGASVNQALKLNFGTPIASGGTGLDGTTGYGSPSSVAAQSQDGYTSGALTGITIDANGVVNGSYTNGQAIPVGKLAIAKFPANNGLGQAGQNLWTATKDSGLPAMGDAGTGGRASLVTGSLENSNVDISTQFVDLIAHQASFQADSKTITTADQMLQALMQMKQ